MNIKKAASFIRNLPLFGDPYENRTRDSAVRGRRLNRLTNGPYKWENSSLSLSISYLKQKCKYFWGKIQRAYIIENLLMESEFAVWKKFLSFKKLEIERNARNILFAGVSLHVYFMVAVSAF